MGKKRQILCVVLGGGILYLFWVRITGLSIPCLFRSVTGWLCPGCGITTLFVRLSRFDIAGAFRANPFLFVTGPLLVAEVIYYNYLLAGRQPLPRWNRRAVVIYAAALCVFGVIRNIC